jgi:hypothetical protein
MLAATNGTSNKNDPDPSGKHVIFCDNFYTHHILASLLKAITEGEFHLIGKVRFLNVDVTNRHYLKTAIEQLKKKPRGSWLLVCVYDRVENYGHLQCQHASVQRRFPEEPNKPFHATYLTKVAEIAGCCLCFFPCTSKSNLRTLVHGTFRYGRQGCYYC